MDQTKKVKTKKKGLHPKIYAMFYEIRYESTQKLQKQFLLTISRALSTILRVSGLDLHSSSPELINFFGAQTSLGAQLLFGGAQAVIWEGTAP